VGRAQPAAASLAGPGAGAGSDLAGWPWLPLVLPTGHCGGEGLGYTEGKGFPLLACAWRGPRDSSAAGGLVAAACCQAPGSDHGSRCAWTSAPRSGTAKSAHKGPGGGKPAGVCHRGGVCGRWGLKETLGPGLPTSPTQGKQALCGREGRGHAGACEAPSTNTEVIFFLSSPVWAARVAGLFSGLYL